MGKYAVWLMPEKEVYDYYYEIIKDLSSEYDTPQFEPHITLCSGIQWSLKDISFDLRKLVKDLKEIPITIENILCLESYYQSLVLQIKQEHTLTMINRNISTIFQGEIDKGFFPHLSLMYSKLENEVKEGIKSSIDYKEHSYFKCNEIRIMDITEDIQGWNVLEVIKL